ncbi:MFS transporter [Glutamicibacter arilaitensis]|uniref:MFS transporter n=1 Tax=Glutamicibacter arilaitensis TaxID=256701 RepID=UPI00385104C6
MNIKARIDASPMSRMQMGVITICLALNFIDGYDVLVMAFSADNISADLGLSGGQLGILLASALLGMALGALFIAPVADRIGRRNAIIASTSVITLGMLASAFAPSYEILLIFRVITGLAVGTMQTSLNVLVSEYANNRRRATAVSIYSTGQPIGGVIGGMIVAWLLATFADWRVTFIVGAIITAAMLPVILRWLPESIDYLNAKRQPNALEKINKVLARMHQPALDSLPEPEITDTGNANLASLFRNGLALKTILLAFAMMMIMGSFYFANSWTPKLLTESGFSSNAGITAGVLFSFGAIIGSLLFAWLGARYDTQKMVAVFAVAAALAFAAFGYFADGITAALVAAVFLGISANGAIAGMFSLAPSRYDANVRATAVGLIGGIGRAGGVISPILAGSLIDAGWIPADIYFVFVIPLALGALALFIAPRAAARRATRTEQLVTSA